MKCPRCGSDKVSKDINTDGDIFFTTECSNCGFNKTVSVDIDLVNSLFAVTHYDWYNNSSVYAWAWSHAGIDRVKYNDALNYYTIEDEMQYKAWEE